MIARARQFCSWLIVAINGDHAVTQLKGRCQLDQVTRSRVLTRLKDVDEVVIFDEMHPGALIRERLPRLIFKGSDYANRPLQKLPEYHDAMQVGAAFVYLPVLGVEKISSSALKAGASPPKEVRLVPREAPPAPRPGESGA